MVKPLSDSQIKTVTNDYTTGLETLRQLSTSASLFTRATGVDRFDPITVERRDGKPNDTVPYFSTMHHDVALEGRGYRSASSHPEAEVVTIPELVKSPGWIDGSTG